MKRKIYIPIWFISLTVLIAATAIIATFIVGEPEGGSIRSHVAYRWMVLIWLPVSIFAIITIPFRVIIEKDCFKIRVAGISWFSIKKILYDDIVEIDISKGKYYVEYLVKMKEGNNWRTASWPFLRKKQFEKDMAALAEMINSKNALENKEGQAPPPSETINN